MLSLLLFFALVNRYNNLVQKLLKISQQTFWQVIVKIITSGSGFIIIGMISRTYGEAGVGNFTLALTYLTFFYTLSDFGFNAHVLKRLQGSGDSFQLEWRKLLGVRILWAVFLVILASLLIFIFPSSFSSDFRITVWLGSLIVILFAINVTTQALFQSKHRYDLDILPTIAGVVFGTAVIYLVSSNHLPVYLGVLGYLLAWFVHASGALLQAKKFIKNLVPLFNLTYTKTLFISTWPIAGTLFFDLVYFKVDSFILSYHYSASVVGVYNLAYQIFQSLLVLPTFAMNAFYPMMLQTLKEKSHKFRLQIKLAALGLFLMSILIGVTTYLLAPWGVSIISGNGFEGSVKSLQILSFGFPAFFLSSLLMWIMVAKGMYKRMLGVYIIGLSFNLIANLMFIPQGSFIASSWITGISEYLILFLQIVVLLLT